jgi:hypothetical protein
MQAALETGWLPPSPNGIVMRQKEWRKATKRRKRRMKDAMIGLDLAKNVIVLHGVSMMANSFISCVVVMESVQQRSLLGARGRDRRRLHL